MGKLGVPTRPAAFLLREPDDDAGNAHFRKSLHIVHQVSSHDSGKKALRLFEIAARNAHVAKAGKGRPLAHWSGLALPLVIEPGKIDRPPSLLGPQRQRCSSRIILFTVNLKEVAGRFAEIEKRLFVVTRPRMGRHAAAF